MAVKKYRGQPYFIMLAPDHTLFFHMEKRSPYQARQTYLYILRVMLFFKVRSNAGLNKSEFKQTR